MSYVLPVKRLLKRFYIFSTRITYRLNFLVGFRNSRYVFRLISRNNDFFPEKLEEKDYINYMNYYFLDDFKSGRISYRGMILFTNEVKKIESSVLHCALSRVLFEGKNTSDKLKKIDRFNDAALLELLIKKGDTAIPSVMSFLKSTNNARWSASYCYRLVRVLYSMKEWLLVKHFSELYRTFNPGNSWINNSYLTARVELKDFARGSDFFGSDAFNSIAFVNQVSLVECLGKIDFFEDKKIDNNEEFLYLFYMVLFQKLIISGQVSAIASRSIPPISNKHSFKFLQLYFKEKFLSCSKYLFKLEKVSFFYFDGILPLKKIYDVLSSFSGDYGGDGWSGFVEEVCYMIYSYDICKDFDESFLELIGYSQVDHFASFNDEEDPVSQKVMQPITALVCISRVTESFFLEANDAYCFSQVVGYTNVDQVNVDPRVCQIFTLSDLMPEPGSLLDLDAFQISHDASHWLFSKINKNDNQSLWATDFINEVFSLAIEDRLFGHIKKFIALVEHLRSFGISRVVFSYKLQEYALVQSLSKAVNETLGIECFLVREFVPGDLSQLNVYPATNSPKISFFDFINRCENATIYCSGYEDDAMLIMSSLGDPAYYKSSLEILKASDYSHNYVFNVADRIIENTLLLDNVYLIDSTGVNSFDSMDVSFNELLFVDVSGFDKLGSYSCLSLIQHTLDVYLARWTTKLKNQIEVVLKFLEHTPISSLITSPGRSPLSRAITLIANSSGIRTVDVQAFFISSMPRYKGSLADNYCGITRDQIDVYIENHSQKSDQRVYCIGSLMMDNQLSNVSDYKIEDIRVEYGLGLDKFVIFFAEQHGDGGYSFDIVKDIISTLEDHVHLIVKLHPRSPMSLLDKYHSLVKMYGKETHVSVTQSGHLYKLIIASDVVVTQFSNVGLEAAVLKKKVLSVLISGQDPVLDFGALGIADVVYNLTDMKSYISELIHANRVGEMPYLISNPELGDGRSGSRVIEISHGLGFYSGSVITL
ncbi:CDP-glycerol glycerophosphotransferase family protein [Halomonas alkaliantarctica]|uniref:CDP-glycerol glycerophosphotransferase family protein n=1 Tax=Halomonas alkaliantarctica TaxID=232346 RepID=A0ABY8LQD1_9GAMM|nr:CDP-glycerol glycerophosphotransferase family protein [Halomonas alkaliantarctica]WGI26633.1 CDP-glycerol glycerophosphotransferase family protein [Halomonas alkaliantarctica]